MHYRQPLSLTLFQREKGSATRLCVPVHPVYWLIWRQICRQLEFKVHYLEWNTRILHATVYLESKFDLRTLSCRHTARLYRALYRAIETSRVLIRTNFIVLIVWIIKFSCPVGCPFVFAPG